MRTSGLVDDPCQQTTKKPIFCLKYLFRFNIQKCDFSLYFIQALYRILGFISMHRFQGRKRQKQQISFLIIPTNHQSPIWLG